MSAMKKRKTHSPFAELDKAYKLGKKTYGLGAPISSNPYPVPEVKTARNHTPYGAFQRGWLGGRSFT